MGLGGGFLAVFVTAFVIGLIRADIPITAEILERTAPRFFDLMIALAATFILNLRTVVAETLFEITVRGVVKQGVSGWPGLTWSRGGSTTPRRGARSSGP